MKNLFLTVLLLTSVVLSITAQKSQVIETRKINSEILKMERNYAIYLPPGYDETDRNYPVLYLLHGSGDDHTGWVQFGNVQHIADKTIGEGKAAPMIIVMPDANTKVRGYFNVPDGSFPFEDFFFKELIPFIEKNYRVRSERRYRAVSGLSMGGGGTIYYTMHQPEMFAAAAPLSATTRAGIRSGNNVTPEQMEAYTKKHNLETIIDNASEKELNAIKSVRWYISCGDDDFLYRDNSLMHILFREKNIPHEYRIKEGGHTWTYWRMELPEVLEFVSKSFMQF
jgi:enterochelin esterase-like enzyme